MVGVARRFKDLRECREQQEIARKRQWEEDRRRYEQEREHTHETVRFRRLVQQADDRATAAEIRALVDAVRTQRMGANSESATAFERRSTWALAHADRIDPLLDDEFFYLSVSDQEVFALEDHNRSGFGYGRRTSFWGGWRGR